MLVVGNGEVERVLSVDGDRLRTTRLGEHDVVSAELALVLDASTWRVDVPGWRFAQAEERGWAEPGFDDSGWRQGSPLHPLSHPRYDGGGWSRWRFSFPAEVAATRLTLVLGGLDDEDWLAYRVLV